MSEANNGSSSGDRYAHRPVGRTDPFHGAKGRWGHEDIREQAKAVLAAAFEALEDERVLPTTRYHPFVRVGSDYFGGSIMSLREFRFLGKLLEDAYPNRFAEEPKRPHREFASSYNFSLVEAAIARCGTRDAFSIESEGVNGRSTSSSPSSRRLSTRSPVAGVVSHITTTNGEPVQVGDVLVVSERNGIQLRAGAADPARIGTQG